MGACTYVGRVGGLAVALGVGAAVLGGTAVGWADDDAGSASAASNSSSAQSSRPGREARGTAAPATGGREAAGAATARSSITPDSAAAASPRGGQPSGVAQRGSELSPLDIPDTTFDNTVRRALPQFAAVPALADAQPVAEVPAVEAALAAPAAAQPAPAADEPAAVPAAAVQAVTVAEPVTEPLTAPESAPVASILTAAVNALTDPFADGTPGVPVDSTLDWTALAFARRNPLSAASTVPLPQRVAVTAPILPLIMGPSGVPIPSQGYGDVVMAYYIPDATQGTQQLLFTPEGLYPITGVKSLPLDTSTDQGVQILSDALSSLPAQTKVTVFGYSQSAIISSLLQGGYTITVDGKPKTFTVPSDLDVSFVMVGDEMNPDGGFLSRFSGRDMPIFSLTSLGIPFYGATPGGQIPPDGGPIQTYYDTTVYTREYDGFADFPRYPINFLADLNAGLGIVFVHTKYAPVPSPPAAKPCESYCLTQAEVENAIALPSSRPDTQHYFFIPTENLPLLEPLRLIPFIGKPLAALFQPALKVMVDLGYGDPAHGFNSGTQAFANELVPFGVSPTVDPAEVFTRFIDGVKQGVEDFLHELGPGGSLAHEISTFSVPSLSPVSLAGSGDFIKTVQTAITAFADYVSGAAASLYAGLLPTADIINSLLTTLPAYDVNLFLYGMQQVFSGQVIDGLINSIGLPLAADVGLVTTAGLVGALVWGQAVAGALPVSFG